MAVYLVSLERLARMRARSALCRMEPENAAATERVSTSDALAATLGQEAVTEPAPSYTRRAQESSGSSTSSPEELLNLSKSQIETLLSGWDELGRRAFLALIHRLASVESQLADLRVRGTPPSRSAPVSPIGKENIHEASQSELLEQVFRKNLSLRMMD